MTDLTVMPMAGVAIVPPIGEAALWAMGATAVMIILDCLSGLAGAAKEGVLSSTKMREGLWHKAGYVLLIALAVVIEIASAHLDLGFEIPLTVSACIYIIANEILSVTENVTKLNPALKYSRLLALFKCSKVEEATTPVEATATTENKEG